MKKAKKKTKANVTITAARLKQIKEDATDNAIEKCTMLFIASIMEKYNLNDDDVCEIYGDVLRWTDNISEHLLKINTVADIIREHTGAQIEKWSAPAKGNPYAEATKAAHELAIALEGLYPGEYKTISFHNGKFTEVIK